jgi:hypothetical protein
LQFRQIHHLLDIPQTIGPRRVVGAGEGAFLPILRASGSVLEEAPSARAAAAGPAASLTSALSGRVPVVRLFLVSPLSRSAAAPATILLTGNLFPELIRARAVSAALFTEGLQLLLQFSQSLAGTLPLTLASSLCTRTILTGLPSRLLTRLLPRLLTSLLAGLLARLLSIAPALPLRLCLCLCLILVA